MRGATQEILGLLRGLSSEERRRVVDEVVREAAVDLAAKRAPGRIFIAHRDGAESERGYPARTHLEKLENRREVFLSSDWKSMESGVPWFSAIVGSIKCCDELHAVVAEEEAWGNPWMNFELGVAVGAGKTIEVVRQGKNAQGGWWEVNPGSDTPLAEESERPSFRTADDWRKLATEKDGGRYLAHVLREGGRIDEFQDLILEERYRPVTSRDVSRQPRARAEAIFSIRNRHFYALIDGAQDIENPWLNYEIGVAVGRGLLPIILVSGGIDRSEKIAHPITGIHLVYTGDTNRLAGHFRNSGFLQEGEADTKFAAFFRQDGVSRRKPLGG